MNNERCSLIGTAIEILNAKRLSSAPSSKSFASCSRRSCNYTLPEPGGVDPAEARLLGRLESVQKVLADDITREQSFRQVVQAA